VSATAAQDVQLDAAIPGTLGVNGVLSFDTATAALRMIQDALAGRTVGRLDLAGVRRSDSAGLACVLAVVAEAAQRGQALQVVNMPTGMQVLAQVCEVDRLVA
jgi:phospholipid transport system transporter-binding protein